MSSKTLSWDKRCTCCAMEHSRMSDSALFVCSSFIVTHCNSCLTLSATLLSLLLFVSLTLILLTFQVTTNNSAINPRRPVSIPPPTAHSPVSLPPSSPHSLIPPPSALSRQPTSPSETRRMLAPEGPQPLFGLGWSPGRPPLPPPI